MALASPLTDFSSNSFVTNSTETSRMFPNIFPFDFDIGNIGFDIGAIENPFAPPIESGINSENQRKQRKRKTR